MNKRDHRPKLTELFANTTSPFRGSRAPFSEVFPDFAQLEVVVAEQHFLWGRRLERKYTLENPPGEDFDCSNQFCYGGGFSICDILRRVHRERLTQFETYVSCSGYEGSPKGRRKYKDCVQYTKVTVKAKYRRVEALGNQR
jgi:hypothetical protein